MTAMRIEHVNITVTDPERSAAMMEAIFGWRVRWRGPARDGGRTVHVGSDEYYLALYASREPTPGASPFSKGTPLNHVGVEVDDLDATEEKVVSAGLVPFSHDDYDPGRRFYFFDPDGIVYEVVSYRPHAAV